MSEISEYTFKWEGEAVNKKVRDGIRWGIDSVMADCVTTAKSLVPKKTTALQGSLQMRQAADYSDYIAGFWGSFTMKYAEVVEFGSVPHVIVANKKTLAVYPPPPGWTGKVSSRGYAIFGKYVFHPGTKPRPYLMPAAERHHPSLGLRIRAQIDWGPS